MKPLESLAMWSVIGVMAALHAACAARLFRVLDPVPAAVMMLPIAVYWMRLTADMVGETLAKWRPR